VNNNIGSVELDVLSLYVICKEKRDIGGSVYGECQLGKQKIEDIEFKKGEHKN
jgi:hypothetical protein